MKQDRIREEHQCIRTFRVFVVGVHIKLPPVISRRDVLHVVALGEAFKGCFSKSFPKFFLHAANGDSAYSAFHQSARHTRLMSCHPSEWQ